MWIEPGEWPTLSRLLDAALDVEPTARELWLDSLPETDRPYQGKLRELLRQHAAAETRDFLETLPKIATASSTLAPGAQVGPYIIEEEIGRGGMGAVWRARRNDGVLDRVIALKLPHLGSYGGELVERFGREKEILATLAHPHIARLYDAGMSASGQPYLALEYVDGQPITRYCDSHRLDVRQRLELFQQVLSAVQYAHRHLVIHRDLKPSNVIVTAEGQAMLLDFGIAKLAAPEAERAAREGGLETQVGATPLTPDYASPEQVSGESVTTASDLYSLGVLLFELLTADRPYRLKRASRALLEEAILNSQPQRPSEAVREGAAAQRGTTPKILVKALRGDLDTIVLKALKKSPADRYPSADAFSQDIQHYLRREPVAARPDSRWYRAGRFVSRYRIPVAAATVAAVAIIAVAGIALLEAHEAGLQRDRAVALSSRSEAVTDFLYTLIAEAAQAEKPVTVSDMLARSEAVANLEYRQDPVDRAAVLGMLGSHYHTMGDESRSEPLLHQALDIARTTSDAELVRQLTCDHAIALAGQGNASTATPILQGVIADPQTSLRQAATCLNYLAFIAQDEQDGPKALRYANLAVESLAKTKHVPLVVHALYLGSVGYGEHLTGHNTAAHHYYEQSLAEFTRAGRERGPDAISVRNNWAIVSDEAGAPKRALELYEQTMAIVAQNDPSAPMPTYLLANRAKALESTGHLPEARDAYQTCRVSAAHGDKKTVTAYCTLGLATVARLQGSLPQAHEFINQTAELLGPHAPPRSRAVIAVETQRGELALMEGHLPEAQDQLDAAIRDAPAPYVTMEARMIRAQVYAERGNLAAAEADARLALKLTREQQGDEPFSDRVGAAWLALGKVLAKKGDRPGAAAAYRAAVANLSHTVDEPSPHLQEALRLAGSAE